MFVYCREMNSKLITCVLILQSMRWTSVECVKHIGLSHHYVTEGDVLKPVCENKDEYVVAEGEEVILNLKKVEIITFAQCSLEQNASVVTADSFINVGDSNIYQGKLKHIANESYNCSFYVLKEEEKRIEPISIFNYTTYVRISCIFKIKLYREKPILLDVVVNGEALTPSRKSINNTIKSEYKYIAEQKLMVVCKKKKSVHGNVEITFPDTINAVGVPKAPIVEAKFELNNPSFLGPYFTLKCFLRNDNDTLEIFNIDFAPKKPENEIDIDGLPMNNIIQNQDDNRYLYYKYTDIEEVNMKCSMGCFNAYCLMEMWYNAKKINYTQWTYNININVSHTLVLTPADNSSVVKCVGLRKPATEIITQYIYVTLLHANEDIKGSRNLRGNGCFDTGGEKITSTNANCTNSFPGNREYSTSTTTPKSIPEISPRTTPKTLPTTVSTNSSTIIPTTSPTTSNQSSTAPALPKSMLWLILSVIFVLVVIVLLACLACKRRRGKAKAQRPQLPLPESVELDNIPNDSQNQEQHEYEEIPNTVTRPLQAVPDRRHLRRIPEMRWDPNNGKLIVKGKAVDLQKLLKEADYVDMK